MEENNNKSSVYFQNGCRYMELNEFQNAINEFDKLISVAPSVDAYKNKINLSWGLQIRMARELTPYRPSQTQGGI